MGFKNGDFIIVTLKILIYSHIVYIDLVSIELRIVNHSIVCALSYDSDIEFYGIRIILCSLCTLCRKILINEVYFPMGSRL